MEREEIFSCVGFYVMIKTKRLISQFENFNLLSNRVSKRKNTEMFDDVRYVLFLVLQMLLSVKEWKIIAATDKHYLSKINYFIRMMCLAPSYVIKVLFNYQYMSEC